MDTKQSHLNNGTNREREKRNIIISPNKKKTERYDNSCVQI